MLQVATFRSIEETTEKLKSLNTIGYFGDSFCANRSPSSWTIDLAKKLKCKIVNHGKGGSSIWTAILDYNFLVEHKQLPDISIFCWTNPYRLYHPKKSLTLKTSIESKNLADSVKKYFAYLWFDEKELLNYKYVLEHFDNCILKNNKKIFFHIFSINPNDTNSNIKLNLKNNFIKEFSLLNFSGYTLRDHDDISLQKTLINHMTKEKNIELAEYFYQKISNRQN